MLDLNNFTKKADELIFYLDDIGAKKMIKEISKDDMRLIEGDPELRGAFIALRFLIIPFLRTNETADLLKNNLYVGLNLDELDIAERIKKKLLFLDLADRDNCKKALKEALVKNEERITEEAEAENKRKIKTINDWLKDYISHTGIKGGHSLERANYFQKPYFSRLDEEERKILKKLFDLYNFLNISSLTPEGFEDDVLLKTEDGRLVTTHKGQVITLYDPKKIESAQTNMPKARPAATPQTEQEKTLADLKNMLTQYPEGSLERKVIEEEVGKLNNGK